MTVVFSPPSWAAGSHILDLLRCMHRGGAARRGRDAPGTRNAAPLGHDRNAGDERPRSGAGRSSGACRSSRPEGNSASTGTPPGRDRSQTLGLPRDTGQHFPAERSFRDGPGRGPRLGCSRGPRRWQNLPRKPGLFPISSPWRLGSCEEATQQRAGGGRVRRWSPLCRSTPPRLVGTFASGKHPHRAERFIVLRHHHGGGRFT